MGLGFFVLNVGGHGYVYHDGDQGGFSSEMLIDPARHAGSILVVNTTDTGAPAPAAALHPQSNTEPEAAPICALLCVAKSSITCFPGSHQPANSGYYSNCVLRVNPGMFLKRAWSICLLAFALRVSSVQAPPATPKALPAEVAGNSRELRRGEGGRRTR